MCPKGRDAFSARSLTRAYEAFLVHDQQLQGTIPTATGPRRIAAPSQAWPPHIAPAIVARVQPSRRHLRASLTCYCLTLPALYKQ